MIEELEDVKSIEAAVQERIHALKCSLSDVQPIIHCVFEWPHLNLIKKTISFNLI